MIDVSGKNETVRVAKACGRIRLAPEVIEMVKTGDSPKGNILAIAEVAGIMAAKNTPQILPLCHPLLLNSVRLWFEIAGTVVTGFCEVSCEAKTGVEMEALTGINVALLTIYDLAKAVNPVIEIEGCFLMEKRGGKSGLWQHPNLAGQVDSAPVIKDKMPLKVGILVMSDRASQGTYKDASGPVLAGFCQETFAGEVLTQILPDDEKVLEARLCDWVAAKTELILISGGTGLGVRDVTPEVVQRLACKELSGFGEAQRILGSRKTEKAWLSRSSAFVIQRGEQRSLVVLFPGSPKAVREGLEAIGSLISHAVSMMRGGGH